MPSSKKLAFTVAQWLLAAAIIWFAIRALRGQWALAGERLRSLTPNWALIGLATLIVLATYVLLIETWRRVIIASGETLRFRDAARIWFVSNLGKYVPGKIWSIAAMSMMARRSAVSAGVAAGSSILIQLVTIAAGIAVVLACGASLVDNPLVVAAVAVAIIAVVALSPRLIEIAAKWAGSLTGKQLSIPRLSAAVIWMTAASSALSWILYGVAFQLFVRGILGSSAGATTSYIAVYAASYIIGFLALFAPGGAVVRESAIVTGMVRFALSGRADALAVAVTSRLWLTVTELVPGLAYMAARKPETRT
ncbi:MAG TPA: lysylphosphatidylglycerol synthase domain-containing protein [Gemmatimonadaceae bacterium]